ncbi:MAG TPA: twin-arginine translocase subunit TatC [Gemmatimonadaceae bacterium]|nr:twin-arginine translocase subunit TatC [Gemmatimonadaceae bacterium]
MANKGGAEMPFLDHLEELRWRLIWSLAALGVGILLAFAIISQVDVIRFLEGPILPFLEGRKLVFTHPGDPFGILLKSAFALGLVLALPVILYQVWAFLSPALYQHEKRVVIPVLLGAAVLFGAGVALSFFIVLPITLRFLLGLSTQSLEPMITAGDYFGFAIGMSLAFGAVFELPIAILALTALGIVTPQMLRRFRRHAVILCVVGSAFITPGGDPLSLMALFFPLYLLFELSIWLSAVLFRRRERRQAEAAAEAAREATA